MLTTNDLARLRKLMSVATPGPWVAGDCFVIGDIQGDNDRNPTVATTGLDSPRDRCDARLIATAVNALPELLSVYEAVLAAPVACHRTITGNGSAWSWIDGPASLGALDNLRVHPNWRIENAVLVPLATAPEVPR